MKALTKLFAAITLVTLAACGGSTEPNRPAGGGGDENPLATIQGRIQGTAPASPYVNPKVGLVWVTWDSSGMTPTYLAQVAPVDATSLPVSFSMSLFAPPPAAALNEVVDANGTVLARYGWGLALAFEDRDNDDTFTMDDTGIVAPDLVFGASWFDSLFYVDTLAPEVASSIFANPADATVGFHVARLDPCTGLVTILDASTTVVIDTFAPSSNFDDGYPAVECGDEAPCKNESSPACQACLNAIAEGCFTQTCAAEVADLDTCGQLAGCTGTDPAAVEACLRTNCDDEVTAYEACLYPCLDPSACYEAPPAP